MANKPHAIEWVEKAYHDLDSAKILYEADHFTDTIGYILHQSIEKLYKSCLAYENVAIVRTHNLVELNELVGEWMNLDDAEIHLLAIATTYHTKQRYPSPHKRLPPREEIKEILDLNIQVFQSICQKLGIEAGTFGV